MLRKNTERTHETAVGLFAQPRDAAQQVEEDERAHPNLRKGDYQEKEKGVV
jgi:hypothetical protein